MSGIQILCTDLNENLLISYIEIFLSTFIIGIKSHLSNIHHKPNTEEYFTFLVDFYNSFYASIYLLFSYLIQFS